MKKILFYFLLLVSTFSYAQISQRCPVCPPSLNGVPSGYVLTDSSGKAVWQASGGGGGLDSNQVWKLHGNAGTDPSVNFIGTTDKDTLVFKVNNVFSGRIWGKQTSIGKFSLQSNTTGTGNTAFGYSVLKDNTTGVGNVGIGNGSLNTNTTGISNTAVGNSVFSNNHTGSYNVGVGLEVASNLYDGDENVFIGDSSAAAMVHGFHNACIGSNSDVSNDTSIAATAIGAQTIASDSSVALGLDANADTKQFALSQHITNIKAELNGQTAGYVLTTNGTTADWQSFVGTPIKDSIATTGATVSPAINTTHVITSSVDITSATLSFPSGNTGDWIIVIFNKAIATLTNSGTGATTVGLVSPLLGTSKTYVNINGLWY